MNVLRVLGAACVAIGASALGIVSVDARVEPQAAQSAGRLPADINPESRNRLPLARRDELSEAEQRNFDRLVAASPAPAGLQGPAGIRLHGGGSDREITGPRLNPLVELSIISTARAYDQQFEWTQHEPRARTAGVDYGIIDIVRYNRPLTGVPEKEASIIQISREVFGKGPVTSETFARAHKALGKSVLVDSVALMGRYCSSAIVLNAFDQQSALMPIPVVEPPADIRSDSQSRLPMIKNPTPGTGIAPDGTGPGAIRRHASGNRAAAEAALGPQIRAIAALVTAREFNNQYDWTMNEVRGKKDGLSPAIIDVIKARKPLTGLPEKESTAIAFGRELLQKKSVASPNYARALKVFGEKNLVDLAFIMGEHCGDEVMLKAFDQHLPPGQPNLLTP